MRYIMEDLEVDLSGVNLGAADLIGANLKGASLREVSFVGANLMGADLRDADLNGANFEGATITEVDFRGARNLDKAKVVEAHWDKEPNWPKGFDPQNSRRH